jgi:two-component system, OmpR family, alkaline phosphatase synthesis response regulator PhoP
MAKHILIIDDEAHIVQVLSLKLRNAGYEITTAVDGEEGLEIATRMTPPPDLIITDFQMPYMTGLELCRALATDRTTAHIPVIMLTARGYALEEADLAIGNIKDVLSKPFSPRAIVEQVQRMLGGSVSAGGLSIEGTPNRTDSRFGDADCAQAPTHHIGNAPHERAA